MLCFLSLKRGDASLMTPIMGSKPVFVAIFVATFSLTPNSLTPSIWIAVALATLSITLIGWPSTKADFSQPGILLAVAGAAGFGLLDSLVPFLHTGPIPFFFFLLYLVPLVYFQFYLFPGQKDLLFHIDHLQICGCGCQPSQWGQAICMSMAIGFYQIPTQANIFYAGRGFWSIILVALLGGWLGLQEGKSSPTLLLRRMVGALLLLIGVWLTSN